MSATRLDDVTKTELEFAIANSYNYAGVLRQLGLSTRQAHLYKRLKSIINEFQISLSWGEKRQEQVRLAVATSSSASEALKHLGLSQYAGNYKTLNNLISKWDLSIDHWRQRKRGNSKGHIIPKKPLRELSELLVSDSPTNSSRLKKRLLKEGLLKEQCCWDDCPTRQISTWRGEQIKFDLDHINGDSSDNRLENLRILCKICHAQTPTFSKRKCGRRKELPACLGCGKSVSDYGRRCRSCAGLQRSRISWPTTEELIQEIKESSVSAVARRLGVTGNAVRKRIRNHPPVVV